MLRNATTTHNHPELHDLQSISTDSVWCIIFRTARSVVHLHRFCAVSMCTSSSAMRPPHLIFQGCIICNPSPPILCGVENVHNVKPTILPRAIVCTQLHQILRQRNAERNGATTTQPCCHNAMLIAMQPSRCVTSKNRVA